MVEIQTIANVKGRKREGYEKWVPIYITNNLQRLKSIDLTSRFTAQTIYSQYKTKNKTNERFAQNGWLFARSA